jgi:uncharacterized membrane protein YphA (DoxX/SURF4 family)
LSPALIQAVAVAGRFFLAFTLLAAAVPKFYALDRFEAALSAYRLLPIAAVRPLARLIPWLEVVAGIGLVAGVALPVTASLAGALFFAFAIAIATNLVRGREIDCGCGGRGRRRTIGWDLVVSNAVLVAIAITSASVRPGALAFDGVALASHADAVSTRSAIALALIAILGVSASVVLGGALETLRTKRSFVAREEEVAA